MKIGFLVRAAAGAALLAALLVSAADASGRSGAAAGVAAAGTPAPGGALRAARAAGLRYNWQATSPAIHLGDRYRLAVTNGETPQKLFVRVTVMDHSTATNAVVLEQMVDLAAGEQRVLEAQNEYGTANHFKTLLATQSQDLAAIVTVTNAVGKETTRFTEDAFWVKEMGPAARRGGTGQGHDHGGHDHGAPTGGT